MRAALAVLALAALVAACGGGGGSPAAPVQQFPNSVRPGAYYGFYGSYGASVDETRPFINLVWESQWNGVPAALDRIQKARLPVVLDVYPQIYDDAKSRRLRPDAEARLRDLFQQFRGRGLLSLVIGLYPIDEPDINVGDEAEIRKGNAIVRKVRDEFQELHGAVLIAIFAGASRLTASDDFDWVGFDDYNAGTSALGAEYSRMATSLGPRQRTLIVPGGAFGEHPQAWVSFLDAHNEVAAMIPFIWFDNAGGETRPGIRSNGLAPEYCRAGVLITHQGAC